MKVNQANPKRSSFAGVSRIPEIHKKTTSTGTTFRANRHEAQTYRSSNAICCIVCANIPTYV